MAPAQEPDNYTDEHVPLSEIVGETMALVMHLAAFSLPSVALLIIVRTPRHAATILAREVDLPLMTRFFLSHTAQMSVLLAGLGLSLVFVVAWRKTKLGLAGALAPILFALALGLGGLWLNAMYEGHQAGRNERPMLLPARTVAAARRLPSCQCPVSELPNNVKDGRGASARCHPEPSEGSFAAQSLGASKDASLRSA